MDIQEARASLIEYDYLIDKHIGDSVISHIVIAPANGEQLDEIIKGLIQGYSYALPLDKYKDFTLYFIYDLANGVDTGILLYESLEEIKPKLKG